MARGAIDVYWRVLKESNESRFAATVPPGTVYWSYPILPFGIASSTFFPTTFLQIAVYVELMSIFSGALARTKHVQRSTMDKKIWLSINFAWQNRLRARIKSCQNSWSHDCIAGSGVQLIYVKSLLTFLADQLLVFQWSKAQKTLLEKDISWKLSSHKSFAFGLG